MKIAGTTDRSGSPVARETQRAYKHRLLFSSEQDLFARRIAGCCRLVFNCGREQRMLGYAATGRGIGYVAQSSSQLTEAKGAEGFGFLREAPSQCLQQALWDLHDAYERFFSGQNSYPRARRRGENDSFRFLQPGQIRVHDPGRDNQVRLPKLGWVSVRNCYPELARAEDGPRLFEGKVNSVTVTREADGWYACFQCEVEIAPLERDTVPVEPARVGVDRGVANSVALSTGEMFHLSTITDREWEKIAHLQSVVNRRQQGSRNREKAKRRLARYRQSLARRKHDALHKLTTGIVERFPACVLEDLQITSMTRSASGTVQEPGRNVAQKAGLNRAILDQCWGETERQLKYKYAWHGGELWKVSAQHSSNECRACGKVDTDSRESQAVFRCRACGHENHADTNAAQVVLARAERGHGELVVAGPSDGTSGRGSLRARNACAYPAPLKTPEATGPSRKNPARAGNPTVRLPHAS